VTPRVTIGMPAFENAGTLARAINSVLGQSVEDWRLVISDDGSSDDSLAIAARFAESDPRIECSRTARRLGYMNFPYTLKDANSDWVVWLAGDDYWAPRFLEATLSAAEDRPDAASILPRWRYVGLGHDASRIMPLEGTRAERVRQYLAAPGGTRMYGLTRREALQAAFPKRNFHAFDWFLMLGLLRVGPQIEVPEFLLYRERTPLRHYVETAAREGSWPFRRWPALPMSLAVLRAGRVPLSNLLDLAKLNLRKHEEYLSIMEPGAFLRRLAIFRAAGLPLSNTPDRLAEIAEDLARNAPNRRQAAVKVLEHLARQKHSDAALRLGMLRNEKIADGNPRDAFAMAASLGDAEAAFQLAEADKKAGEISVPAYWAKVIAASKTSRSAARVLLEARRNGDPLALVGSSADRLE